MAETDFNPTAANAPLRKSTKITIGALCGLIIFIIIAHPRPDSEPSIDTIAEKPTIAEQSQPGRFKMIGTSVRFNDSALACRKMEDFKKIVQLDLEDDGAAVDAMLGSGRCQLLEEGTTGTVQDSSVWNKAECVRLPGDIDCLWAKVDRTEKSSAKF